MHYNSTFITPFDVLAKSLKIFSRYATPGSEQFVSTEESAIVVRFESEFDITGTHRQWLKLMAWVEGERSEKMLCWRWRV